MRKRRTASGLTIEDELRCWKMVFTAGYDFFGDLKQMGFAYTPGHERDELEDQIANAWGRLGPLFMKNWESTPRREQPWAWDTFGPP